MVHVYVQREGSSTTVSICQGEGSFDDTLLMSMDMSNTFADALIGDLLDGAVTVHGEGGA